MYQHADRVPLGAVPGQPIAGPETEVRPPWGLFRLEPYLTVAQVDHAAVGLWFFSEPAARGLRGRAGTGRGSRPVRRP